MIVIRITLQTLIAILLFASWSMLALLIGYGDDRGGAETADNRPVIDADEVNGVGLADATALAQQARDTASRTIASDSELISFSFTPASAAEANAAILAQMMRSASESFDQALAWARESKAEVDPEYWRRHTLEISDYDAFVDARLISIGRTVYIDGGGAHPNIELDSLLWDIAEDRAVALGDLFEAGRMPDVIRDAWRADLGRQKNERFGGEDGAAQLEEWLRSSPVELEKTPFILARSNETGRAGGVVFLHGPYSVGAYVEGSYFVTVAQTLFADALRPAYRASFAGAPVAE